MESVPGAFKLNQAISAAQAELRELEYKLKGAREEWNAVSEFLTAQGIDNSGPIPHFDRLKHIAKLPMGMMESDNPDYKDCDDYQDDEY